MSPVTNWRHIKPIHSNSSTLVTYMYPKITWSIVIVYVWPDLPKGILYTHSFKTHFSLPFDNCINGPTAHVFKYCLRLNSLLSLRAVLKPVWYPWVLGWSSNDPIFSWQADSWLWFTTRLADEFGHGLNCFVWHMEVKMAPMEVIWLFLVKT